MEIRVSVAAETPELSFLHEIGHFLDHQGLTFQFFLSQSGITATDLSLLKPQAVFASETNPMLSAWREAVMSSNAVAQLQRVSQYGSAIVRSFDGSRIQVDVDHGYTDYLQEHRELFARSYAQYVVSQSQDEVMHRQLYRLREEPLASLYPLYWQDKDFLAIAEALQDVFAKRGWIV